MDGALFLFSFTDRASFSDLPNQISRVAEGAKNAVKIVIGTKYPSGSFLTGASAQGKGTLHVLRNTGREGAEEGED